MGKSRKDHDQNSGSAVRKNRPAVRKRKFLRRLYLDIRSFEISFLSSSVSEWVKNANIAIRPPKSTANSVEA